MLDTVWRLSKKDFGVDDFLNKFYLTELAVVFHQGERKSQTRVHDKSGFNIAVSGKLNSAENVKEINEFVIKYKEAFDYLVNQNINSVLDIGCTVGTVDQFTKSVNVPFELLGILNKLNVSLVFSAYPASDEEDET